MTTLPPGLSFETPATVQPLEPAPAEGGVPAAPPGGWHAELVLRYRREGERTVAHDRHVGPLRVLRSLFPEGPGICHHVIVHPPGGIVGGDVLAVDAQLGAGAHAVVTTPGAARFYRSAAGRSRQSARLALADGARLEWLPLETIAHPGCDAENRLSLDLAPGAEAMGWDLLALGLPAAGQAFSTGRFRQRLEWPGRWLEAGCIDAADAALLDGALGLAGHRVIGTAWLALGTPPTAGRRQALLDAARAAVESAGGELPAGVTSPQPGLLLLRLLAGRVEPAMRLMAAVRAAWRREAWGLAAEPPRIWRT